MYIVKCNGFVDSVTASKDKAGLQLKKIKLTHMIYSGFEIKKVGGTFPFYIIEREKGNFEFTPSLKNVSKAVKTIKRSTDADPNEWNGDPMTIYVVEKEYVCKTPGLDRMGELKHAHVDNSFLDAFDKGGIENALEMYA